MLGLLINRIDLSRLWYEFHMIASTYGWTPDIIRSLPRSERKRWVYFIEEHMKAMWGSKDEKGGAKDVRKCHS